LAPSVLRYAFHCKRSEGRVFAADLLLRIAGGVPPRLDFVHVLELENDDAVRWGLASYRKSLIEPPSDVFAPIVVDGLLRPWEEVLFVTVLVLDGDFINNIGGRRCWQRAGRGSRQRLKRSLSRGRVQICTLLA
jgi:hypothetical protein